MEYLVSNINFEGANRIGHIYVKGKTIDLGNKVALCEGYILDEKIASFEQYISLGIENNHLDGIYEIIEYNIDSGRLIVKGDYNGLRSIYIYQNKDVWAISNNVWLLVREFTSNITVNQDSLISQIVFITDVVPGRTVFNEIRRLNYGEKITWEGRGKLEFSRYWDFNHNPLDLSEDAILESLDDSFIKGFSLIKARNPNLKMGVGCSGGLDSRIIMHYANKVGINHVPYVFCQKQRIKGINTATYLMSDAVASYFGKSVIPISTIDDSQIENSILLDLRNQPSGFCQLSKNPIDRIPSFNYMITGQPGRFTFAGNFLKSDNIEDIINTTTGELGNRMYSFGQFRYILRKLRNSFPFQYNSSKEDGITGLNKSLIDRILPSESVVRAKNELRDVILNIRGKSNYETWFRLQGIVVNTTQYAGGYESISHLKPSYYLYLLGWDKILMHLTPDYIINKKLLKRFINYINPGLSNIPDQHLNKITDSRVQNIFHQMEYIVRGQGINVESLIATQKYQLFAKEIISRDNPIFFQNISKGNILNSGILKTSFSPTLIKRKLLIDIFYYKEFDKLLNQSLWEKV